MGVTYCLCMPEHAAVLAWQAFVQKKGRVFAIYMCARSDVASFPATKANNLNLFTSFYELTGS